MPSLQSFSLFHLFFPIPFSFLFLLLFFIRPLQVELISPTLFLLLSSVGVDLFKERSGRPFALTYYSEDG